MDQKFLKLTQNDDEVLIAEMTNYIVAHHSTFMQQLSDAVTERRLSDDIYTGG